MPTDHQSASDVEQASNSTLTEPCLEYNVQKESWCRACETSCRTCQDAECHVNSWGKRGEATATTRAARRKQLRQDLATRPRDGDSRAATMAPDVLAAGQHRGTEEQRWLHQTRRPVDQYLRD